MGEKKSFGQAVKSGFAKFGDAVCSFGRFLKKNWRLGFELRKVILSIPVVVLMLGLADQCRKRLPEMVGINLLENGGFEQMMARETAISITMAITVACLVFMFFSRKTVYPWLISLMSLLLPLLLIVTNTFPA